jgi:hypothetical protein
VIDRTNVRLGENLTYVPRDAKRADARAKEEAAQAATKSAATSLRRFARNYHDEHVEPLRSTRHALQWINSIERNVPGKFLDQPIDRITPLELLDTLVPIMRRVPETGSRIYRRLSTVFDAAVIGGRALSHIALYRDQTRGVDGPLHEYHASLIEAYVALQRGETARCHERLRCALQIDQDARHCYPVDSKVETISAARREGTHRPRQREGPLVLRHSLSCEASRKPGHRQ